MKQRRLVGVLLVLLGTTGAVAQQNVVPTRDVVMELSLPNGAMPQLRVADGGTGTVELKDVGKFGFVPSVQDGRDTVVVDVYDLNQTPHQRLRRAEVGVGGDTVQSQTKPDFGIRIVSVITK